MDLSELNACSTWLIRVGESAFCQRLRSVLISWYLLQFNQTDMPVHDGRAFEHSPTRFYKVFVTTLYSIKSAVGFLDARHCTQ